MATKKSGSSKSASKAKKAKKPPKAFNEKVLVAAGLKKAPAEAGEVSGHGAWPANYICWGCGAINFVPGGIYGFYCWRCGRFNTAP